MGAHGAAKKKKNPFVTVDWAFFCCVFGLQEDDCKNMVDTAVNTFGGLHVAFNNAGVFMAAPLADVTQEIASKILDTNLKALIFCFKYQV